MFLISDPVFRRRILVKLAHSQVMTGGFVIRIRVIEVVHRKTNIHCNWLVFNF